MEKKIVFITGATSGIGEACARKFAQGGYDLILNGRSPERLQKVATLARKAGAEVQTLAFDVRQREAATQAVTSLQGRWGEPDILINNAGLALGVDKEYEGNMDEWETMIDTNIKGLLTMTRLIVPGMVERNRGHVINLGSLAGEAAYGGGSVYCSTKAAVKALSDGLRIDLAHTAVRVTNIKPGLVETHFSVTRYRGNQQQADNVYHGIHPLTGDDIADIIFFAASAPAHVQIAEVLVTATHQANSFVVSRSK